MAEEEEVSEEQGLTQQEQENITEDLIDESEIQNLGAGVNNSHFQLRDLLYVTPDGSKLYYYSGASDISSLNLVDGTVQKEFSCSACYCLCVRYGFLCTTNGSTTLVVYNVITGELVYQGTKSTSSINGLSLSYHGVVRLVMATNDSTITVFELPSMREITKLNCSCCVNYSIVSPDGKFLAGVGDSHNIVYLYNVVDEKYTAMGTRIATGYNQAQSKGFTIGLNKLITHSATSRSSMTLSWNTSSTLLCCGSEDGLITVYDMSKVSNDADPELVFSYNAKPGQARVCKFSPVSSIPLLVATNSSQVHVIEIGTWKRQTWKAPKDVHGLTFSPDGKKIYVGTLDGIFEIPFNLGLRSLVDMCIWFIKKRRKSWETYGWDMSILPFDLKERLLT